MNLWKMAWRNVRLHLRRSLITGLAIAFGYAGVLLLGGYMIRMENYLSIQGIYLNHVGHLAIYKKDGLDRHLASPEKYNLSRDDQDQITAAAKALRTPPEFIARYLHGQGIVTNGCSSFPFLATAAEPEAESWTRRHSLVTKWVPELKRLKAGRGFWESTELAETSVVAYRLAELLKKPLVFGDAGEDLATESTVAKDCQNPETLKTISRNDEVQLLGLSFDHGIAAADTRIAGHYSTGLALSEASSILLPLKFAQSFYGTDKVTWLALFLPEDAWVFKAKSELEKIFRDRHLEFDVYSYRDDHVNAYYVGAMNFVYVMVAFFLALVCGVVALSILNSLQISLLERKVELGTMRAIGFRPDRVTALFVREALIVSSIALLFGCILAFAIAQIVNWLNLRFLLVGTADDIQFMLKPGLLFAAFVGIIFIFVISLTCQLECNRRLKASVVSLLEKT
jgi:putative ABC transport system permease protein